MPGVVHTWIKRGSCSCGMVWTTPGSPSVRCACGVGGFVDGTPENLSSVTDEAGFHAAVAAAVGLACEDVNVVWGGEQ